MNTIDQLRQEFPNLFENCIDYSVPKGWTQIIEDFLNSLGVWGWFDSKSNRDISNNLNYLQLRQVKEKFGTLRIYYTVLPAHDHVGTEITSEIMNQIQGAAVLSEYRSSKTCQECGGPASTKDNDGYIATVCDLHKRQRKFGWAE